MNSKESYAISYLSKLNFDLPIASGVGEGGRYPQELVSRDAGLPIEEDGVRWRRYRHRTNPNLQALLHPDEPIIRLKNRGEESWDFHYDSHRDLFPFEEHVISVLEADC